MCEIVRLFDEQRVHFAKLASQQAESYFKNLRDVSKAGMETNIALQEEKADREAQLKAQERAQDQMELQLATEARRTYVNTHDSNKFVL